MRAKYIITEYGSFVCEKDISGYVALPEKTFIELENFILSSRNHYTDALEIMSISAKKGIGKVITAKNYVGVLSMNDGTTIEILPKVYSEDGADESGPKKLLIDMLKTLKNSPFKSLQTSNVNIEKMSIFEVFIRMFIDEVMFIAKRGLRCNYETVQSNERFYKGKIKLSEHIKHNYAHKERSYVEYDNFSTNRPENKLLKSTLQHLYSKTISSRNKRDIKTLLNAFSEVDVSNDYNSDFLKCITDRNMGDYYLALDWCRVFLLGKSFTFFAGSQVAFALLFPMETLFENYIATHIKKLLSPSVFSVSVQDKSHHLFDFPNKKFLMKPDIVIKHKLDNTIFVLDTKWKILSDIKPNFGISQPDMYQMYAYQKKYIANKITLLFPLTEKVDSDKDIVYISNDGACVSVRFVDLFNIKDSLATVLLDVQ